MMACEFSDGSVFRDGIFSVVGCVFSNGACSVMECVW